MRDQKLDLLIGNLLRVGVILAAMVVLAGGAWYLTTANEGALDYQKFRPVVTNIHAITQLPGAEALILAGLLLLIATPVARVVLSLVAFAAERDGTYVVCTLIVLLVLLYSIGTAWL